MFNKILIANRGEIACRIMRTAKHFNIFTVAVYSDADANSQHVQLADEAYRLGPAPSRESYLVQDKIIEIAKHTHAQAIHPGYGFLSENAGFSKKCTEAGIIFIGPPTTAIELMGSKSAAKKLMQQHNVPLLPGYHGDEQDLSTLEKHAEKIGYPILLKASAGGGGKGMRIVWKKAELAEQVAGAKREAKASFNDDKLLLEKYLTQPRHIEVQIFADQFGNIVHLFERDCSIQRRYQKIIEESPATHFSSQLREKLTSAAITAARAINYVGAGTIEFLVDGENFYFMEMNTRLQVEHPVTEKITGLDLVEWQLRVASGEKLPLEQKNIKQHGHAIEARICAEDPAHDFLPSSGKLKILLTPELSSHVRIDSGVRQNDSISVYYDPMLAKLIVWESTRELAVNRLQQALADYHVVGVKTNIPLLTAIAKENDFFQGNISTAYIKNHEAELLTIKPSDYQLHLLIACCYARYQQQKNPIKNSADLYSPWHEASAFRINLPAMQTLRFTIHDQMETVNVAGKVDILECWHHDQKFTLRNKLIDQHNLIVWIADQMVQAKIYADHEQLSILANQQLFTFAYHDPTVLSDFNQDTAGKLTAPMPGMVIAIHTAVGKKVQRGDKLLIMEAMKMEHTIRAPDDGIVKKIHFKIGDQVNEGVELLLLENA